MGDIELSETASCTTRDEAQRSSQSDSEVPHFALMHKKKKNTCAADRKMSAILAREYIYRKGIHFQPKKVEAKDAAAYQEAPAQTFLRHGNLYL